MKKHCIAMLLAGGQGSRLYALTAKVAKPSLPFGGKYRIIDFPLSNCANSGIDTVGVLTQYQPLLLNRYIGSGQAWDLDSIDGGVYILPPYQSAGERGSWFSGTANAIYQNMDFIEMYDPDCVLIDGNPMHVHPKEKTLVKGDARIACIAAASIVAKVTRDSMMVAYDEEYPGYHLAQCKGCAYAEHIAAIKEMGLSPIHPVSFCGNFLETPPLF